VDGTRSHGHTVTGVLLADGRQVVEATRPGRKPGRGGKSDLLDATAIARATLATEMSKPARPRAADILTANQRITHNLHQLRQLVAQACPRLLDQPGVGPVTAATALTAWSHLGRLRSEADFAKLAGTAPLEAGFGRITRHRLNRGGDRTLNSALHTIALARRRCHPTTRDYVNRRHTEGKTGPEITRSLKRYIARQLFKIMETSAALA
jgi:transposase